VPSKPDEGRGNPPGSGAQSDLFQSPTDVAWDAQGNIFVADGIGNARIAKFTRDGVFVKSWGSRGTGDNQFRTARGIAVDAAGNVYVANGQIIVYDPTGKMIRQIDVPERPIQLLFGGSDRRTLFILTHHALYAANPRP
jgi:DNA-binding beta-propeller fold protein YncE